jgi:hypothetical protein
MSSTTLARDLVCKLEQFFTPEKYTKDTFFRDANDQPVDWEADPAEWDRVTQCCEMRAFALVTRQLLDVAVHPGMLVDEVQAWAEYTTRYDETYSGFYSREIVENNGGVFPLTPEQEEAVLEAYNQIVLTAIKLEGAEYIDIPRLNDGVDGYARISKVNQEACATLRGEDPCSTPTSS